MKERVGIANSMGWRNTPKKVASWYQNRSVNQSASKAVSQWKTDISGRLMAILWKKKSSVDRSPQLLEVGLRNLKLFIVLTRNIKPAYQFFLDNSSFFCFRNVAFPKCLRCLHADMETYSFLHVSDWTVEVKNDPETEEGQTNMYFKEVKRKVHSSSKLHYHFT